jgi:glycosyltransferase involved in cell wall biosynthesis
VFEKWIARYFDYVVAAAEDIRGNFKHHRIATVRNFPPVALAEDSPASRMHSGKKEHVLIYIGGLSKIRGICEIIRALEVMRVELPVRLELVGSFSPPDFEDEIRQLKGFARTEYLGVKPWADVMEHLRHADIGLVCFHPEPNHLFPRSNKLFEYMSVGLPVIASNFPQWKAIVEGSNCGLTVNPLDPGEIAQAIEYLIRHPDEARKMGENGRKAVLEKYNWEKEGKELLRVYEELTKR